MVVFHPLEHKQALLEAEDFLLFAVMDSDSELVDDAVLVYSAISNAPVARQRRKRRKRDDFFFTTKFYTYRRRVPTVFPNDQTGFSFITKQIENHYDFSQQFDLHGNLPSLSCASDITGAGQDQRR